MSASRAIVGDAAILVASTEDAVRAIRRLHADADLRSQLGSRARDRVEIAGHVRADFVYIYLKPRAQAILDLLLYLLFFVPGILGLIYAGADYAALCIESGERDPIAVERAIGTELAGVPGMRLDYARVLSAETLDAPARLAGPTLIALAAYLGKTRLIDNIQIDVPVTA